MKLKKIAALALAGVMAVSMLAGCAGGNGNGNGAQNPDNMNTTATSVVKALNDGQKATNKVKINFTSDTELDAVLKRIADAYGADVDENDIGRALDNLAGLHTDFKGVGSFLTRWSTYDNRKDLKGETLTEVMVWDYEDAVSEEQVLNQAATQANDAVAALNTVSNDFDDNGKPEVNGDDKYLAYTYEGKAGMISAKQIDGTTHYYVVCVIEQHVAEKTA